jgi:hypothetical protein
MQYDKNMEKMIEKTRIMKKDNVQVDVVIVAVAA